MDESETGKAERSSSDYNFQKVNLQGIAWSLY